MTPAPKTVKPPQITPSGGAYQAPLTVTITCPTRGADIRITRDGTRPTRRSELYTGPIILEAE